MKKICTLILLALLLFKTFPIVREKECYSSLLSKEKLFAKFRESIPLWMQKQIETDFLPFGVITQEALDATYQKCATFDRYRILNNQLHKYVPEGTKLSERDNLFERALKTLLLYAKVPNVDFIYCPMDGLPEPYVAKDCYLVEEALQAPVLAQARLKSAPSIILIPDQFSLSNNWHDVSKEIIALNEEISWEEKRAVALWRGGFTDIGVPNGQFVPDFRKNPRYQICKLSSEWVDAGLQWSDSKELDECLAMEGAMKAGASKKEHLLCRYLPVLDGHMCTYPGYQWRLLSNSLTLKQESDQEQWFYSALQPFVHYLPIQNDMSDLIEQVKWAQLHPTEVSQMIQNARHFAQNHLLLEDDYYYLFLVLKEMGLRQNVDFSQKQNWHSIQYRKRNDFFKSIRKIQHNVLHKGPFK